MRNTTGRASDCAVLACGALLLFGVLTPSSAATIGFEANGLTTVAQSVETTQRVDAAGATVHDVVATFRYGAALPVLELLGGLMSNNGAALEPLSLRLTYVSATGTVTEERTYGNVTVRTIDFPQLDSRSREEVSVTVRMEARASSVTAGGAASGKIGGKIKTILASNFRADITSLPSTRIAQIASHRMLSCYQGRCDSLNGFELLVRGADVSAWRAWYQKATREPSVLLDGKYTITGSDLTTPLMTMHVLRMRPVSFTESSDELGPTARVKLSVAVVKLDVN